MPTTTTKEWNFLATKKYRQTRKRVQRTQTARGKGDSGSDKKDTREGENCIEVDKSDSSGVKNNSSGNKDSIVGDDESGKSVDNYQQQKRKREDGSDKLSVLIKGTAMAMTLPTKVTATT